MTTVKIEMPLEQEGTKSVVRAWLKKIGDRVEANEPIVELETDKVAVEVPSPAAGVLTEILLDVDAEARPGAVLGMLQASSAIALGPPAGAGIAGEDAGGPSERLSPLVRRMLSENKIAPSAITGSGRDGRITHADVVAYLSSPARGGSRPRGARDVEGTARPALAAGKIPHDAMRRAIAQHMAHSLATAPHVTAIFELDGRGPATTPTQ